MVPGRIFGGFSHLSYQSLHKKSTLCVILELYANFMLPSVIKSASILWSYLEDIGGLRLELRMTWSTLLCWVILGCPQKVALKVA